MTHCLVKKVQHELLLIKAKSCILLQILSSWALTCCIRWNHASTRATPPAKLPPESPQIASPYRRAPLSSGERTGKSLNRHACMAGFGLRKWFVEDNGMVLGADGGIAAWIPWWMDFRGQFWTTVGVAGHPTRYTTGHIWWYMKRVGIFYDANLSGTADIRLKR